MKSVRFGGEVFDRISITVFGYERAPVGDIYDDNWLTVKVEVRTGGFGGKFEAAFLAREFEEFYLQLEKFSHAASEGACFSTLEDQLDLRFTGDKLGHVYLAGIARDSKNELRFHLSLDQTHIQVALRDLRELIETYPVRS